MLSNILRIGNSHRVGKSKSFTKKGPGRQHNYSGLNEKFHEVDIHREFDLRVLHGRLTYQFVKRYIKAMKKRS